PRVACSPSVRADAATTEIYTLPLHDALPISPEYDCPQATRSGRRSHARTRPSSRCWMARGSAAAGRCLAHACQCFPPVHAVAPRSEEHTSELQSRENLVCRLLLEKKKTHDCG